MFKELENALISVTDNVGHYKQHKQKNPYIVWAEDGSGDTSWADGRMQEQAIEGTIDYFTKMQNDPNFNEIQNALNDKGISFRLESIQYEDDTKLIHYEWVFSIPNTEA